MKFEFGKYTEITDLAFKVNPQYKNEGFVRFFICPDVWDTWFVRILEGYNEDYEREEGSYILERNNVPNDTKGQKLTISRVRKIIEEDSGENWDYEQNCDVNELIDMLDDGFGILNLKQGHSWVHDELFQSMPVEVINKANETGEFDIKLVVNGIDIDPKLLNYVLNNIEKIVNDKAKGLVLEKLEDAENEAYKLLETVREARGEIIEKYKLDV